jgi:uncharacterized protein DUF6268
MKIFSGRSFISGIGLVGLLFATSVCAEESNADTEDSSGWFKRIFSASGEYVAEETYVGEASVRRSNQVVSDYSESDTVLRLVLTPRTKIGVLRLGAEWERFSFGFPDRTPLPNTLQSLAFVVGLDTQLSDSILIRVEAQPGIYGTNNMEGSDFNVPFLVGGTYIYNPNLQIVLGVGVDVERKIPVLPGAGIRWKIARLWVINAVLPAPRLEFQAARNLTLYAGGNFKETSFRVSDDFGNTHGGRSKLNRAILDYSEVRTGVGADWKISSFLTLTGEVGYQPYRSFDFYRPDVRFHEDGSAPYGMLSAHGAF